MTASHTAPHLLLHEMALSLDVDKLANILANVENLLIIQDLDGVCMGLVKDPPQPRDRFRLRPGDKSL